MNRFTRTAVAVTSLAAAATFTPDFVTPAEAATCVGVPGGGYGTNYKTLDSSPARNAPYEACAVNRTYAAGATASISCQLTNNYGNIWFKLSSGYDYIYSGHFSAVALSRVPDC